MKLKSRLIYLALAVVITLSCMTPLNVYADDKKTQSSHYMELSELEITDVDEPVVGQPFDTTAVVSSAEGVEWEIPVIWVDEYGRKVTVPERGKKYFPTFVFFVPEGFRVSGADASGRFSVKYPDFVLALYGTDHVIFAADPGTGATYIFVAGDYNWQQYLRGDYVWSEWHEPEGNEPPDPNYDAIYDNISRDIYVPEPEPSNVVNMYCSQSAIDTLGENFLNWFIGVVKNTLQPQAVGMLESGFYNSLGQAVRGTDLSDKIGLYIYYRTGEIDGDRTPEGAMAYVTGTYRDNARGQSEYAQILAFDTSCFTERDSNGNWVVKGEKKSDLDNTIIHEMLHAFMFDYTRYGMVNQDDALPSWFTEGIAVSVENAYQFRKGVLSQMAVDPEGEIEYTNDSVKTGYNVNHGNNNDDNLDLSHAGDASGNTGSAYGSGYLATVYLGYLDAVHRNVSVIDNDGNFIMESIREGLDDILKRLHGNGNGPGESLDTIISDISGSTYSSADDFQSKFIKGDGEESDGRSLDVVTQYLNWLEGQSYTVNGETKDANGSILRQEQNYDSPLSWEGEYVQTIPYRIANTSGMVASSVDDTRANYTGGKSNVGDGSNDYFFSEENAARAAAKVASENETIAVPENEPTVDAVTEPATEPVTEQVTEAITETEPETEPEAEPEPEPEPEPETCETTESANNEESDSSCDEPEQSE